MTIVYLRIDPWAGQTIRGDSGDGVMRLGPYLRRGLRRCSYDDGVLGVVALSLNDGRGAGVERAREAPAGEFFDEDDEGRFDDNAGHEDL